MSDWNTCKKHEFEYKVGINEYSKCVHCGIPELNYRNWQLADLRQKLKGIEWVEKWTSEGYSLTFCPVCGRDKMRYDYDTKEWLPNKHHQSCWLAAAIGEGGGGEG